MPVKLTRSRVDVESAIQERIDAAADLLRKTVSSREELEELRADRRRWMSYTDSLLQSLFSDDGLQKEFNSAGNPYAELGWGRFLKGKVKLYHDDINARVNVLRSITERLEIMEAQTSSPPSMSLNRDTLTSRRIFIVHGRNVAFTQETARFLERLDLEPIILAEQASAGQTIIEKIEAHADVSFAIVLLTGDDKGALKEARQLKPRARQNVILELGYFMAKLGRRRVCPLYEPEVEIPSDYYGIGYIELDASGAWKTKLVRELQEAGLEIDSKKVI